jgi:hypothetical protein
MQDQFQRKNKTFGVTHQPSHCDNRVSFESLITTQDKDISTTVA